MSSSSSFFSGKVDIFLSFCCENSPAYFENILSQNGINTFRSYRCLETSVTPIDQQTHKALQKAKVAVVMTDETKPYTVGFLEELRVLLECQEMGLLKVIPILLTPYRFHDLEEEICQQYPKNAPSWKLAVTRLNNTVTAFPVLQNLAGTDQSDWLQKIADDIHLLLLYSTSNDSNVLVAMDRHMKVFNYLMTSEVNEEVRIIGIWGSAGVGKTTLAKYIYAEFSLKFLTHIFLENAENMKDKILEFEGEEDPSEIRSLDSDGHDIIQARRKHRKVLLIADDVDNIEQGKWIIECAKWFAPGSRVILISEDENLLVDAGVKHVYEVKSLRYDEALQLFSHFAFGQPNPQPNPQQNPPSDFEQLSVRAVHLAGFLPLALKLLGSFLTGKGREEWSAALLKLQPNQDQNITEVWKLMEAAEEIVERKKSVEEIGERKESAQ